MIIDFDLSLSLSLSLSLVASRSTSEAVPTTTPSAPPAVVIVPPNLIPNDRMSVMPTPCSPAHSVKVWRHRTAEAAAAEFTEDGGEGMVRIYKWTPTGSGYLKQEEEVSSEDFSRAHYNLLGWTIARKYNNYLRGYSYTVLLHSAGNKPCQVAVIEVACLCRGW